MQSGSCRESFEKGQTPRRSHALLKQVVKLEHLAIHYYLHYTVLLLFHNRGGYYNSLILQPLELPLPAIGYEI